MDTFAFPFQKFVCSMLVVNCKIPINLTNQASWDAALRRAETHFFPIYFWQGLTFGSDTKYTTFSKTPEKNKSEFPTILKRIFLITHAFLSKMLLNRPPIIYPLFGGV